MPDEVMPDEVMPPPMFDLPNDGIGDVFGTFLPLLVGSPKSVPEPLRSSLNDRPIHQVKGYLWTTRNKFKGTVLLDYSALNVRNCPSAKQAAEHAFSRAVMNRTLGADAKDLAGHILFVPVTPWGGPVMVK